MKSICSQILAVILCISLIACGSGTASKLITALNAVVASSSVAVVAVEALAAGNKISPAEATLVVNYVTLVDNAANQSITELKSSDSNTLKITKITAYFANAARPAMGPNVSTEVQSVVLAIGVAVDIFLTDLNAPAVLSAAKVAPHAAVKLTGADKAKLKSTRAMLADTTAKVASLKKK